MGNIVNTSVDYNKLQRTKKVVEEILNEMPEVSKQLGIIEQEISGLDSFHASPTGRISSSSAAAERTHDNCFAELPDQLGSLKKTFNDGGFMYNKTQTLFNTATSAINCFSDSEESINQNKWKDFVSGLATSFKPQLSEAGSNLNWMFHYNKNDFESNMTDAERTIFENTKAETAALTLTANTQTYHPSIYDSAKDWQESLINKYKEMGITDTAASELAKYERYKEMMLSTGATVVYGVTSEYADQRINELTGKSKDNVQKDEVPAVSTTSTLGVTSAATKTYQTSPSIQFRTSTNETNSAPAVQGQSNVNPTETQKESTITETEKVQNNDKNVSNNAQEENKEPVIIEEETPVTETPNKDNNSGVIEKPENVEKPTINDTENNNNQPVIENTPNEVPESNHSTTNNSFAPSGNRGNYNSGNVNRPVTNAGLPNENAATTTPSAPESDANIIDNSGETLDVISIDKASTSSSASTSNDGGNVIPTILGVGIAGAAAVAGAKYIHDKKQKQNNYEEETDDDFSYTDNYEENGLESSEKYKAGSQNDLVLEAAPADLKIEDDNLEIPGKKEELE